MTDDSVLAVVDQVLTRLDGIAERFKAGAQAIAWWPYTASVTSGDAGDLWRGRHTCAGGNLPRGRFR